VTVAYRWGGLIKRVSRGGKSKFFFAEKAKAWLGGSHVVLES